MPTFSRRKAALLAATSGVSIQTMTAQTPAASPVASRSMHCGMNYDVGSELARNYHTRPTSHEQFFRTELETIRNDLHVQHLGIFGSRPEQLIAALEIAADLEFDIRLQTRLNFASPGAMVERLQAVAEQAERMHHSGIPVVLDVGCEYLLFADGVIDGSDVWEKLEVIESGDIDWQGAFTRLFTILDGLAREARAIFSGPLTYSDTPLDVDLWQPFDIIGIDHYLSEESEPTYIQTIDSLAASGKPVWINEFGSTANQGAPMGGGMEWDVVDYSVDPPEIIDGVTRDEAKQATNITDTLTIAGASQAERTYVYEFITPASPRDGNPRYDMDLTAYSVVSVWGENHPEPYESTGHWEPKLAFQTIADWNTQ